MRKYEVLTSRHYARVGDTRIFQEIWVPLEDAVCARLCLNWPNAPFRETIRYSEFLTRMLEAGGNMAVIAHTLQIAVGKVREEVLDQP